MHALIQDVGLGYWNTTARQRTTFGSQFSPPTVGSRAQTQVQACEASDVNYWPI